MFSRVISGTVQGIDAVMIQVEADMSDGLPAFVMVGYLSSCVREAAERVRTALRNSGVSVPPRRITVNLSPADIRKDGTAFDLPIAVCILISMGIISEEAIKNTMIIGELGLNGDIIGPGNNKPVNPMFCPWSIMPQNMGLTGLLFPGPIWRRQVLLKALK